jgi:hypothetical protein
MATAARMQAGREQPQGGEEKNSSRSSVRRAGNHVVRRTARRAFAWRASRIFTLTRVGGRPFHGLAPVPTPVSASLHCHTARVSMPGDVWTRGKEGDATVHARVLRGLSWRRGMLLLFVVLELRTPCDCHLLLGTIAGYRDKLVDGFGIAGTGAFMGDETIFRSSPCDASVSQQTRPISSCWNVWLSGNELTVN